MRRVGNKPNLFIIWLKKNGAQQDVSKKYVKIALNSASDLKDLLLLLFCEIHELLTRPLRQSRVAADSDFFHLTIF